MSTPVQQPPAGAPSSAAPQRDGLTAPLVLITLGVLLLGGQLNWGYSFWELWPVLLIVIGVGKVINAIRWNRQLGA